MTAGPAGPTRRALLAAGGSIAAAAAGFFSTTGARPGNPASAVDAGELMLAPADRGITIGNGGPLVAARTYGGAYPMVARVPYGSPVRATVANGLADHTTVHWHGLRIPNAMDGVAFLTQPPIEPGERFTYAFTPPDAGTFFFHPHCDTIEQLGRGLFGVLIIEEPDPPAHDADIVCVLKDWAVDEDGAPLPLTSDRGASGAGTFGSLRTVNAAVQPEIEVPAGADVRVRVLNVDNTRIVELGVIDAPAAVVAIDGTPLPPFPLRSWRLGPAMRADLLVRTPAAGGIARLVDWFAPEPVTLASLRSQGRARRSGSFSPTMIRAGRIPEPDLDGAERLRFEFSTGTEAPDLPELTLPDGTTLALADALCLADRTFWAINGRSWPRDGHRRLPPPLATLRLGRSYVLELANTSRQRHPIHLHGHTFTVLGSSRRELPVHHADTVILEPRERIDIALRADNPGDWMFHCHIIEHQDTGMMGIVRVAA